MAFEKIIQDLFVIRNIIKYIVPEKPPLKEEKRSRLEEEILKDKRNAPQESEFLEEVIFHLKEQTKEKGSFNFKREKEKIDEAFSFVVKYQEDEREERLKVEVKDKKQTYSFEISREKKVPDEKPYQLNIIYENGPTHESLKAEYNLRDYPLERERALQDFTNQLDKTLHILPTSIMGGVLGYTYLGENFMARRADLTGAKALMVDVHEAIHTPDEYETRVLTDWMLSMKRMRYKR